MSRFVRPVVCTIAAALSAQPAFAHGVAGPRIFINTLLIDDPAVADEAAFPTFSWQHFGADESGPATNEYDFDFEFNKRITETVGIGIADGYTIIQQLGAKQRQGWNNLEVSAKWQAYTNAEHEFIVSVGVIREFARTGSANIGNDDVGSTTPTLYWGKGLGDLPIGYLRPLAITGTFGYQIADKELKATTTVDPDTGLTSVAFNNGMENRWVGGLSLQYSLPYLQSQVKDFGLPEFINRLTPVVEMAWSSPATKPSTLGTQYLFGVGASYVTNTYALTVEALIPGNRQTGTNVGVIAQFHLYFDDLFPNSLGKPLTAWWQ
jgi:hypothetical protein